MSQDQSTLRCVPCFSSAFPKVFLGPCAVKSGVVDQLLLIVRGNVAGGANLFAIGCKQAIWKHFWHFLRGLTMLGAGERSALFAHSA